MCKTSHSEGKANSWSKDFYPKQSFILPNFDPVLEPVFVMYILKVHAVALYSFVNIFSLILQYTQ